MINLQPMFVREEVIKAVREFFYGQGFHEIIPAVLNKAIPLESNIYPFSTMWNGVKPLFLSTSPEAGMKKMLAEGIANCFGIGKSFRNVEGTSSQHSPEFLMLEWYRQDADYNRIMVDTRNLIIHVKEHVDLFLKREFSSELNYQGRTVNIKKEWPKLSFEELFRKHSKQTLKNIDEDLFYKIFLNEIEGRLPAGPFFLTDFPSSLSPLCTPRPDKPYLAQRFEAYIFGMELGNGNTENTDTESIRKVFEKEAEKRETHPLIDEEFLRALEKMKQHKYAGMGLGIDRLAMLMADAADIKQVEPFSA